VDQAVVALKSSDTGISDSQSFAVEVNNPVAFLDEVAPDLSGCPFSGVPYSGGPFPLALNSDGSPDTCTNPAAAGSTVRVFIAGLGEVDNVATGPVTAGGTPLSLPVTASGNATVVSAGTLPGSISGVWQVNLRFAEDNHGAVPVSLFVRTAQGQVPVRDADLTIWLRERDVYRAREDERHGCARIHE
jgi:uncharacterized protein (TIGR03437 family)